MRTKLKLHVFSLIFDSDSDEDISLEILCLAHACAVSPHTFANRYCRIRIQLTPNTKMLARINNSEQPARATQQAYAFSGHDIIIRSTLTESFAFCFNV